MRKLTCTVLIVAFLVSSSLFIVDNVHASILATGIIASDILWTLADSPHKLSRSVMINSGVNLTIEPGDVVDLYLYAIIASGTLNTQDTSDNSGKR
jgi:hypothetical protein